MELVEMSKNADFWQAIGASGHESLRKKGTIHQVTTMLATYRNVLFPGHNHLLTTGSDDPVGARVIIKVSGHQYRSCAGGYDLGIGHF